MRPITNKIASLRSRRKERGASAIEFILSILMVLFVFFWLWELVMVMYTLNVLSNAAKEGVRTAIVRGTRSLGGNADWDPIPPGCPFAGDNIRCKVWDYARYSLHDLSGPGEFDVNVLYPEGVNTDGYTVRVVVTYRFVPYLALPVRPSLRTVAEGRIIN